MTLKDKVWTSPLSKRNLYTEEDVKKAVEEFVKAVKKRVKIHHNKESYILSEIDMLNKEKFGFKKEVEKK